jgi:hypothetical protein
MSQKTSYPMNDWSLDNPSACRVQIDCSNLQITSSGKCILKGNRFAWYGSDDLKANVESPSNWKYKAGDFRAVRPLNWDEIIDDDDDDNNRMDLRAPRGGRGCPSNSNDNDDWDGEADNLGSE